MGHRLHIKNMVCPRCIRSVEDILVRLDIPFDDVKLGEASLRKKPGDEKKKELQQELKKLGFDLITGKHQSISNKIKSLIIEEIYHPEVMAHQTLSSWLSEKLHQDYSVLSAVFSKTEGKSIRDYYGDVRIMRAKELLEYDEMSIAEIAYDLGYADASYLSNHFKKATGLTPSMYKKNVANDRKSLDEL